MCKILRKLQGKTAIELLREYKIEMKAPIPISTFETDFSQIEQKAGLVQGSILGTAISSGDKLGIFYRGKDTYNRQRFTIAHELAHCCLHSDNLEITHVELRMQNAEDNREIEANIFAGELLVPNEILLNEYKKFIIPSLTVLSDIFNVSVNVMEARLNYLGLSYMKDANING